MESKFYEVRCEHCRTSFAPETKRCLHCGRPIGSGLLATLAAGAAREEDGAVELGEAPRSARRGAEVEDERIHSARRGRNVLWVVMLLLAMLGSVLRNCQS